MATSNLIQFKRGTSASLATLIANKSGVDGCFYLTVDDGADGSNSTSSRLYVGRANGAIVPVNQGIYTVSSAADLTSAVNGGKLQAGDFAYVASGNIFAVYNGAKWIQINAQMTDEQIKFIDSIEYSIATTDGVASVSLTANRSDGAELTDTFTVKGDKGITVSSDGKALTVAGDEYNLSSDAIANNSANIKLTSDSRTDAGSVKIVGGDNVTLSGAAGNVTISTTDFSVAGVTHKAEANGFSTTIEQADGSEKKSNTIDPIISYGVGETKSEAHFENGTASLDVYTKNELDTKLKGLDAMTYKGTVGSGGSAATTILGITSASIGDTYKASSSFTLAAANSSTGAAVTVDKGDILIAVGTEDEDGKITGTIKFDVIPSGDDTDTTYSFEGISHGVNLTNGVTGNADGSLALAAGDLIDLTDSGTGTSKTVTVTHADVSRTDSTETKETQSNVSGITVTTVTGVTTDGKGHVTGVKTKSYDIVDTNASLAGVAKKVEVADNVATITDSVTLSDSNGVESTESASHKIASDNLTITASGAQVNMNFNWGSF